MSLQRAVILSGLQELSNESDSGRKCAVTFEANANEHWLQCTASRIHMDWPFASSPAESEKLKMCFGHGIRIETWEPDSQVTFIPLSKDVDSLVAGIDSAFQDLYGLGRDYTLTFEIEDLS
jgi:hypothetical protein